MKNLMKNPQLFQKLFRQGPANVEKPRYEDQRKANEHDVRTCDKEP